MIDMQVSKRSDYTFKYNQKLGRHGWLRLTPAYSVKLVSKIINKIPSNSFILDPFSGTATTGLVAAERGLSAHCLDINPFLIWLGNTKCKNYAQKELELLKKRTKCCLNNGKLIINNDNWVPDIHNINRWWCEQTLKVIATLREALVSEFGEPKESDSSTLVWIAFCRLIIETSSATFNHVSMSFNDKVTTYKIEQIVSLYMTIFDAIIDSASHTITDSTSVHYSDSKNPELIEDTLYSHIVTSPPYPNRISYIRELRPYMYWTKFLDAAREAGELDWESIGGTWGIATSRLNDWESDDIQLPQMLLDAVQEIRQSEEKNSLLMANYVWKYFHDMYLHFSNLRSNLRDSAKLSYIVGNSSFYGVQIHTEKLLEESLNSLGYKNISSEIIRKRNSKKELYEYCVSATWS